MERLNNKQWILFGSGDEGRKLAAALESLHREFFGFCDSDGQKAGTVINGKKVISFARMLEIHDEYQIVVAVSCKYEQEIIALLEQAGIFDYLLLREAYDEIDFEGDPLLRKYRKMYSGKRCFLIGTGPSLRVADLEALAERGEITFASNKIFKIFDKTTWRPDIYCAIDSLVLEEYRKEIEQLPLKTVLIADNGGGWGENQACNSNIRKFRLVYKPYQGDELPEFSRNPDKYVIEGFSVTYAMIQWAAYMGFKEIYLLGIDFDYGDQKDVYKHFIDDYDKRNEKVKPPRLDKCKKAYEKAELMSYKMGFRIYNATRGGKLEVFERVDLDELLTGR